MREALPGLVEADLEREALLAAREVVAVNAVRDARPLASLDGRPLGRGSEAAKLGAILDADAPAP